MNYIDNDEFRAELVKCKKENEATPELHLMFYALASNYSRHRKWNSCQSFKEDMVSEATLTCMKYWRTFKPERETSAFSYFTRTCHNAFIGVIEYENKHAFDHYVEEPEYEEED